MKKDTPFRGMPFEVEPEGLRNCESSLAIRQLLFSGSDFSNRSITLGFDSRCEGGAKVEQGFHIGLGKRLVEVDILPLTRTGTLTNAVLASIQIVQTRANFSLLFRVASGGLFVEPHFALFRRHLHDTRSDTGNANRILANLLRNLLRLDCLGHIDTLTLLGVYPLLLELPYHMVGFRSTGIFKNFWFLFDSLVNLILSMPVIIT